LAEQWSQGVRTWGNTPDVSTVMLTGTYQLHSEVSQRLLRARLSTAFKRLRGVSPREHRAAS
jgi:hypothetical protein